MKKVLSLMMAAGFAALIACGPSAEEKQAAEKARQDSINAAMAQMAADSAMQAQMEKARQDSMMMAMRMDSIAKAAEESAKKVVKPVKPKQTVQQKKVEDAKKVTGGRGH